MGFYTPATIVKDAQRHGVKILPVCVQQSDWRCTVVDDNTVRLGFCVVNGLRREHAEQIERERKNRRFESLDDFKRRVSLAKDELRTLAELGALNCFAEHRRAAMWRVEETPHDDLLESARLQRVNASPTRTFGILPKHSLQSSRTQDAFASTQACAPQNSSSYR
jgi:DNA polymerase III alpha subunit